MKYKCILNFIPVLGLVCALLVLPAPAAANDTSVSISAAAQVTEGSDFTVTVDVGSVTDFDVAQYDITYNPAVIEVTGVTAGSINGTMVSVDMWTSINSTTIRVINNVSGFGGVTGSGYLAEIGFHVVGNAEDSSNINFTGNCLLGDNNAKQIEGVAWNNAMIQVISTGDGGGGGGGGGGGARGITTLSSVMNPDGKLVSDITAPSSDLQLYIKLPSGTYCLDSNGNPIYWIYIKAVEEGPTPPEGALVITPYYEMEPDGTTFDPPVLCTIKYGLWDLPEGVDPNDFVVMLWDAVNEVWLPLETQVDTENKTISVMMSHFSLYTVMLVPQPAEFEVSALLIKPAEVDIDEEITVSALVANTGDLCGDCNVIFKVNGQTLEEKSITVAGGESKDVVFTVSVDTAGTYRIDINGLSGEFSVIVSPEPEQEPTSPTVEPVQEPEQDPTQEPGAVSPSGPIIETEPPPETTPLEEGSLEPENKVRWWLYVAIIVGIIALGLVFWLVRSEWRRS